MSRLSINKAPSLVGIVFAALLLAAPVHAETKTDDAWHFQLGTYGWLSGQKGTLATQPGLPAADVDLDFYDDIAGNINGAFASDWGGPQGRSWRGRRHFLFGYRGRRGYRWPDFLGAHFANKNLDRLDGRLLPPDRTGPHLPGRHGRATVLVRGFVSKTGGPAFCSQGKFPTGRIGWIRSSGSRDGCLWAGPSFSSAGPWFWGALVWDRILCGTV